MAQALYLWHRLDSILALSAAPREKSAYRAAQLPPLGSNAGLGRGEPPGEVFCPVKFSTIGVMRCGEYQDARGCGAGCAAKAPAEDIARARAEITGDAIASGVSSLICAVCGGGKLSAARPCCARCGGRRPRRMRLGFRRGRGL